MDGVEGVGDTEIGMLDWGRGDVEEECRHSARSREGLGSSRIPETVWNYPDTARLLRRSDRVEEENAV